MQAEQSAIQSLDSDETNNINASTTITTLEAPSTPSAQLQQSIYGITKKLFNYVSGGNTPSASNKQTAEADLNGKFMSAPVSPTEIKVKLDSLKVCL